MGRGIAGIYQTGHRRLERIVSVDMFFLSTYVFSESQVPTYLKGKGRGDNFPHESQHYITIS